MMIKKNICGLASTSKEKISEIEQKVTLFGAGTKCRINCEDLEYLTVINYEILEYMFRNKANCHIKFSPNGRSATENVVKKVVDIQPFQ